jgi:predicted permease
MVKKTGFTIIGVLPRHYLGPTDGESRTDFYVPLSVDTWLNQDNFWWVQMMGRLAPGADEVQIKTSLELLFRQVIERSGAVVDRPGILLQDGRYGALSYSRSDWGEEFWNLQYVAGLVLLIACTNLAGLLLARGAARQQEMAVRTALGAGRWRLIRQSLTESLILSLGGVCLGLVFSVWLRGIAGGLIVDLSSGNQRFDLRIDGRVLLFALAIGVATTLLSGLFPAWRASYTDPSSGLKESSGRGAPRLRLGKALVTAQMGMSVLFVVVAGLLCRTLINLYQVDPGFDTENLLLVPIDPSRSLSPPGNRILFFEAVRRQIAAIPGVRSAAVSDTTLTRGPSSSEGVSIPGHPEVEPREAPRVNVSEGYFATVGIRLQGRDFLPTDKSQNVVIVNEEFARVLFPQENPLGQFIAEGQDKYQIVGLCANQKYGSLRDRISPILYRPYNQIRPKRVVCLVRSVLPPASLVPAVRRAVAVIDPSLLLEGVMTQKLAIKESLRTQRLVTSLSGSFALLALALCCIGLYGLMAYNVARRTGEMGIRKALGACPWDVAWPILREALTLTTIGVAIGLPVALVLSRLLRAEFYGIEPNDTLTVIVTIVVMAAVAALAAWIPARRAAKIDPMDALRYE